MNIERMMHLADQLENPTDPRLRKVTFNMQDFSSGPAHVHAAIACGTAACIGGHGCILYGDGAMSSLEAMRVLDLSIDQARRLFFNGDDYVSKEHPLAKITRKEAVAAVRRMVDEEIDADWARTQAAELPEPVPA